MVATADDGYMKKAPACSSIAGVLYLWGIESKEKLMSEKEINDGNYFYAATFSFIVFEDCTVRILRTTNTMLTARNSKEPITE